MVEGFVLMCNSVLLLLLLLLLALGWCQFVIA